MSRFMVLVWVAATAFLSGNASAGSQAPFEFRRGLIWVEVHVTAASTPMTFVLDSGAEETVISLDAAQELGLSLGNSEQVRGVGGMSQGYRSSSTTVDCCGGGLQKQFLVLDFSEASRSTGRKIDGLLGADFFRDKVVQIDYPARQIRVNAGVSASRNSESLPIQRNFGAMCVSAQIDGVNLSKVRVDTGSDGGLRWSRPSSKASSGVGRASSVGFTRQSGSRSRGELLLGAIRIPHVDQAVFNNRLFPGEDGLLGNAVLKQFRVTIDMKRQRLILDPN